MDLLDLIPITFVVMCISIHLAWTYKVVEAIQEAIEESKSKD